MTILSKKIAKKDDPIYKNATIDMTFFNNNKLKTKNNLIETYKKNCFYTTYKNTQISFGINDSIFIDLYHLPFAIITGENPMNVSCSKEINKEYNKQLEEKLHELKYNYEKCIGKEGEHSENSFLIYGIKKDESINLGIEFNQYSIFYNDRIELSYIECSTRNAILKSKIINR